jgi:uncharacterized protein YfiM (DUF2279 family)
MFLTTTEKYRTLLIVLLLIHFIGCTTHQKTLPPSATKKDEWFAKDKVKHFSISFLIGALTYSIARGGEANKDDASIIGFSVSSACGIAKEINDEIKHNGWSYKDLVWDILGGGTAVSISNALD